MYGQKCVQTTHFCWFVPMKVNLYAAAYKDISDSVLPTLCQQFVKGLFLFQHVNSPVKQSP